jgi:hypothetical protein
MLLPQQQRKMLAVLATVTATSHGDARVITSATLTTVEAQSTYLPILIKN